MRRVMEQVVCSNGIRSIFVIKLYQFFQAINDELLLSPSHHTRAPLYAFLKHFPKVRNDDVLNEL